MMNYSPRIYLAAPFLDKDAKIRHERYDAVTKITARLMIAGNIVFSPLTHSYYLSEKYGCPNIPDFWAKWYLTFLDHWATLLYVLRIPGWDKSNGVAKEIEYATMKGLPIIYLGGK